MRRNGLVAVGGSNYSRLSCHEYDFDRGEHVSLALDTNRSFVANVACASARQSLSVRSIVPISQGFDNLKDPSINWVGGQDLAGRSFRSREGSFRFRKFGSMETRTVTECTLTPQR